MNSITVNNITKKYMNNFVLDNVSFSLEKGKVYGLLGKNGAGKTTLLKIITKLIPLKMYDQKVKISYDNENIAALISNPSCYMNLSVKDNLSIYSMLYYKNKDEREKEIEKIIKDFTLESMLRKKANELSLGMLQKLKLALSFITNSNIVILDEPFNGLDIESTVILKEKIKESKKLGKTIIITSHNTEQLEKICDSFAILHQAKIINVSKEKLEKGSLEEIYCDILAGGKTYVN